MLNTLLIFFHKTIAVLMLITVLSWMSPDSMAFSGEYHLRDTTLEKAPFYPDMHKYLILGAGIGATGKLNASAVNIKFNLKTEHIVWSAYYNFYDEAQDWFDSYYPYQRLNEFGLMAGIFNNEGRVMVSGSTGISLITGKERGDSLSTSYYWLGNAYYFETVKYTTIGLPLDIDLLLGARRGFNAGLNFHANINPKYITASMMLSIRIGRTKPRHSESKS